MDIDSHEAWRIGNDYTHLYPSLSDLSKKAHDYQIPYQSPQIIYREPHSISKQKNYVKFYDVSQNCETIHNLLHSKQTMAKTLTQHLSGLIQTRAEIAKANFMDLETEILKCRNQLLEIERFYLGQNRVADQRRLSIEQRLFDLYREKRAEESSCWRDQSWLKRDLISLLREYLDLQRRKNLISEILGDDYSVNQNDDRGTMPKT